ncbi:uncharacterized protein LOC133888273 isoform X3 [Phragmites australis]|uniref:uncharacterized protein LOC133888273 isoform X3 n=1 Tax=Phragmites australis TaxID=29695 RepID=UPI002D77DC8C|nr:uncharacterized protein LOC133888273 isoform X3 [Phragmites australis]
MRKRQRKSRKKKQKPSHRFSPPMAPLPGIVEVRCAGCGETLEVEHGMTEFACPDCGTAQALPPELMPPRPRRALPLPRRGAPFAATPSRVACGGCGAVLSVPHGQGRFACPLCGAELAASHPAAAVTVIALHAAVPITPSRPTLPPGQVRTGLSSQSTHAEPVQKPIHSEQTHGQRPGHSFREEPFSSFRADTGPKIPVAGRLQNEPANPSSRREESRTKPLNETICRPGKKKSIFAAGPESFRARKVQEEHPNQATYASEAQGMPSKSSVDSDKSEGRFPNDTVTMHNKQKTGHVVVPSIIEHEQIKCPNQVVNEQQAGESPNNMVCVDQVQVDFASKAIGSVTKSAKDSKGNQKRKNKSLMNSSNELPHPRRSKRLVKASHDPVDTEPIQRMDASPNQNQSVAPQIERTLADPHPSCPARYQFHHRGSNELDDVDATTPAALDHGTQQDEQFPHSHMYSPETRWALPVPSSNSWHEHEIPQESFSGVDQLDRGYEEVCSVPSETQNQDMNGQLKQEACGDKNRSGQVRLKPHSENLSEHGMQKRNGFTGSSSNDAEHRGDWSFSGTHYQINLSASCSRLPATLPFPAATTLPTITSPSREILPLNCSSPTLPHQQLPSPFYLQDAPCGDVLPGSISNSSKKRRGRAPEKLMEPRKEADRPVLTPSGTDWNVHPPCPKVTNTLSLLIKQNYPGTYVSVDTSGNGQACEHVVYRWHQCPPNTRANILEEFLKRYKWSPDQEEECQKIFDRKAVRQLVNLFCYEKQRVKEELAAKKAKKSSAAYRPPGEMELEEDDGREDSREQQGDESMVVLEHDDPLKWKPFVPGWMKPKWWEMLCDHWAKDEVMKVSYQKRKNRNSGKRPCNTAGSLSMPIHQQLVGMGNGGKLVSDIDSPTKIPSGKGESVDQKACRTEDTEARGTQLGSRPVQGHVKRGRYCGTVGVSKKAQNESLSKSSQVYVSKQEQEPMFTKEQVQEMINQALQGLNEVWEKKFLSLEQKMPSMFVPDGAKESLLAVGRNKQCQLARQDTLGSVDGEKGPAAGDDGDNQDEEQHSS